MTSNDTHQNQEYYVRFSLSQRIEHIVLMTSFFMLGLTGLVQKYSEYAISQSVISFLGGIQTDRLLHRGFAVVFGLQTAYHLISLLFRARKYGLKSAMMPGIKDIHDFSESIRYYLGLRPDLPEFGRFSWKEKMEYWAVVCGAIIMGATGFIMWWPTMATRYLDGQFVPASKAAHGGEAVLAVLAILIWHMYNAHLRPGAFPMDASIFTGKVPVKHLKHERPLEYREYMGKQMGKQQIGK